MYILFSLEVCWLKLANSKKTPLITENFSEIKKFSQWFHSEIFFAFDCMFLRQLISYFSWYEIYIYMFLWPPSAFNIVSGNITKYYSVFIYQKATHSTKYWRRMNDLNKTKATIPSFQTNSKARRKEMIT